MNKLFTKIAALVLGMTMAVGVGVAVGTSSKVSEVKADTSVTDRVITFKSTIEDTGGQPGAFSTNGTKVDSYTKMTTGKYATGTADGLFGSGNILSSSMKVEYSAGTFETWSGNKTVLVTAQLLSSSSNVLASGTETITLSNNSETTYRGSGITLAKPSDPSQIASLKVTFSSFSSGTTMRFKYLRLNYSYTSGGGGGGDDKWVETAPANLATDDIVAIVDKTSSSAMSNNNGTSSAPAATSVTLNQQKTEITSSVGATLQWVVTKTTSGNTTNFKFKVSGSSNYLYTTNSNNGVRVGTNENNIFTISSNWLLNTATERYVGVYTSGPDWRCYDNTTGNIKDTVTAFYKKTSSAKTMTVGTVPSSAYVGDTLNVPTVTDTDGAVTGITWTSSNTSVATYANSKFTVVGVGSFQMVANKEGYNEAKSTAITTTKRTMTLTLSGSTSIKIEDTITATAKEGTTTLSDVTFSSSNTNVATVNQTTGVATAVAAGTFKIVANKTNYNEAESALITVSDGVKSIEALLEENEYEVAQTISKSDFTVAYTMLSGDEGYTDDFTVDETLPYTFTDTDLTIGSKTFTVSYGGKTDTVTVDVVPASAQTHTISWNILNGKINGSAEGSTTCRSDDSIALIIVPNEGYKLCDDSEISITGEYDHDETIIENGQILLSYPTSQISISAEMIKLAYNSISVTSDIHLIEDPDNPSHVYEGEEVVLGFSSATDYLLPDDITVEGVSSYSWINDADDGVLTFTGEKSDITITITPTYKELTGITLSPASATYTLGEAFEEHKPTVYAEYTKGDPVDVTLQADFSDADNFDPFTLGPQVITISFGGEEAEFTATVVAKPSSYAYSKITSLSSVTAGDYIIAYSTFGFDGRDAGSGYTTVIISNNKIAQTVTTEKMAVHIEAVQGGYTLKTSSTNEHNPNKYISFTSDSNSIAFSDAAKTMSIALATSSTHTSPSTGDFAIGDSKTVLSWNNNSGTTNQRYKFYKTSTTTGQSGSNYKAVSLYKKTNETTPSLIRITAEYTGGEKVVGDPINVSDFSVKKQYDTGEALIPITAADGVTITSGATLEDETNYVTLSYTEGNVTKTFTVTVTAKIAPTISLDKNSFSGSSSDGVTYSLTATVRNLTTPVYHWSVTGANTDAINLTSSENSGTATFTMVKGGSCSISVYASESGDDTKYTPTVSATVSVTQSGVEGVTIAEGEEGYVYEGNTYQLHASLVNPTGAAVGTGFTWSTSDSEIATVSDSGLITGAAHGAATITATSTFDTSKKDTFRIVVVGQINAIDHDEEEIIDVPVYGYQLTESLPALSTGDSIDVVIASKYNNTYYAMNSIDSGSKGTSYTPTVTNGKIALDDASYVWTLTKTATGYTISNSDGYLKYSSGTNIEIDANNAYNWTFANGSKGTYRVNSGTSGRALIFSTGITKFGGYATSNIGTSYLDIEIFAYGQIDTRQEQVTVPHHYANIAGMERAQLAVINYAQAFNAAIATNETCETDPVEHTSAGWEAAISAYNTFKSTIAQLTPEEEAHAKNMIKYAKSQYSNNDLAACVEKMMETYSILVGRGYSAFMADIDPVGAVHTNPISIFGTTENTNAIAIVVIVSVASLTAIGGYFFLKKRREQN